MSIKVMSQVWEKSSQSGTHLLMMLAISDYADDEGNSYPAVVSLARKCRMTPRNTNYILRDLQLSGELMVLKNEGPKGTNRYRIMLASLGDTPLKPTSPLKKASPLKPTSSTPEAGFPQPLKPTSDEPSLNRQEPSKVPPKRVAAFDAALINLPDWLPGDLWAAWVADRKERGKPITARAASAQMKQLEKFLADGHDPALVIENSIAAGYQGLFPPKASAGGARNTGPVMAGML